MISTLEHFGESIDRDDNLTRLEFCICNRQSDQFHHIMDSINNNSSLLSGLSEPEKYVLKVIGDKKWNVKLLFDALKEMHGNKPYPCSTVNELKRFFLKKNSRTEIFQLSPNKTEVWSFLYVHGGTSLKESEKYVLTILMGKKWNIETLFEKLKEGQINNQSYPCVNVDTLRQFFTNRKTIFQLSDDKTKVWSVLQDSNASRYPVSLPSKTSVNDNNVPGISSNEYVLDFMKGKKWNIETLFLKMKESDNNKPYPFSDVEQLRRFFKNREKIFQMSDDKTEVFRKESTTKATFEESEKCVLKMCLEDKTEVFTKDSTSKTTLTLSSLKASETYVLNVMEDKKWNIETLFLKLNGNKIIGKKRFTPGSFNNFKGFLRKRKNMFQFSNDEKEVWTSKATLTLSSLKAFKKYVLNLMNGKKWNIEKLFLKMKDDNNKPYPCSDVEQLRRFFKNRKKTFQLSADKTEVFTKTSLKASEKSSLNASEKYVLNVMEDKKWNIETLFFKLKGNVLFTPGSVNNFKMFLRKRKNMFQFSNDEKEVWSLSKGISVDEYKIQEFKSLTECVLYYMDGKNWNIEDLFSTLKANHKIRCFSFQSVTELTSFFKKRKTIFQLSDDKTEVWSFGMKSIQDITENINCHVTDENFEFMSPIEVIENEDGILTL